MTKPLCLTFSIPSVLTWIQQQSVYWRVLNIMCFGKYKCDNVYLCGQQFYTVPGNSYVKNVIPMWISMISTKPILLKGIHFCSSVFYWRSIGQYWSMILLGVVMLQTIVWNWSWLRSQTHCSIPVDELRIWEIYHDLYDRNRYQYQLHPHIAWM